MKRYCWIV